MKMNRTIAIGWLTLGTPIDDNIDGPENFIKFRYLLCQIFSEKSYHLLIISLGPFNLLK